MKSAFPRALGALFLVLVLVLRVEANAILQPKGSESQALSAKSLAIESHIQGAFARTTLTTTYKNPNTRRIEADFIYSAPKNSVVTGFAYWFNGEKVVARVVEKKRAARIYQFITSFRRDPALIEMIGKNAFRARIFPVEANQDLKIEIQLAQTLEAKGDGLHWTHPLGAETREPLENFRLSLQAGGNATSNFGEISNGKLEFERANFSASSDLRVQIRRDLQPLYGFLLARRDNASGDGFFALQLVLSTPLSRPRLEISGVSTYDVLAPQLERLNAWQPYLVVGRYRKAGRATVFFGDQKIAFDFGDDVEARSVAASLWAQTRLEMLSKNPKNQFEVVRLSQRFGLVSKWTSWLAIPSAERANFERMIQEADQWNASRAYAQAVARGDRKTSRAQKQIFERLSKTLGNEATLNYALNNELEIVMRALQSTRYSAKDRVKIAQWKKWQRNLKRAGAQRESDRYARAERVRAEIQQIAPLYLAQVEAGLSRSKIALQLKNRMARLEKSSDIRSVYGTTEMRDALSTASYERGQKISYQLAKERAEGKLSVARERDLKTRLSRLQISSDTIESGQRLFLQEKIAPEWEEIQDQAIKGRDLSDAARDFEQIWEKWRLASGARGIYHQDYYRRLQEQGEKRLAAQIRLQRESEPQNLELAEDIRLLRSKAGQTYSGWELKSAWRERSEDTADALLKEQLENGKESQRAAELRTRLSRETKNADQGSAYDPLLGAAARVREDVQDKLIPHVLEKTETSPVARELTQRLEKLSALDARFANQGYGHRYWVDWELTTAWKGRAHEVAYKLLDAEKKEPTRAPILREELEKLSPQAKTTSTAVLAWEKKRRDAGLPLQSPNDYYRLRPGDPLISISAPLNCVQVLAVMPDGILLPLKWNASTRTWEARFDVPTWAPQGDYAVQIVVVFQAGVRQKLTMHFAVDTEKPSGAAQVKAEGEKLELRLETDSQTDRVSAFLSDGSRVELKRDETGVFRAESAAQSGAVRFVLTDKAHNRTEIVVEP